MDKLSQEAKLALSAALALAIGVPVTAVVVSPDDPPTLSEAAEGTSGQLDPALVVNTAKYHEAVMAAKQAAPGALVVDLLSPPVEPGESVTTGAYFPRGARLVGDFPLMGNVQFIGAAEGAFSTPTVAYRDEENATWIDVTATNTSSTTRRLTALVEYEVTP